MTSSVYVPPPRSPLHYLYADRFLLVVDKPAGLLSVPGRGEGKDDCLAARVQADYPEARIVHRLDMETSGLMVLARGAETHRCLSVLFQERRVEKRYLAVVYGRLAPDTGEIDLPLITDWPNRPRQKVDFALGKPSLTRYMALAYDAATDTTRVALEPETGRSHQLRVHLMSRGHPILGDALYACPEARKMASRLMLHAMFLGFPHPVSGEPMTFGGEAPF